MVPLAGIEPALLAETDFESVASTNSATGAREAGFYTTGRGPPRAVSRGRRTAVVDFGWSPGAGRANPCA